jgi:two-component system, chemotaxis family, protein-glutamate methylesterase/glutaminase
LKMKAVVIGGSAGGLSALSEILSHLPGDFPYPIMVVLHLAPTAGRQLPQLLSARCKLAVKEAEDTEKICPGCVYVAPADYHLLVERDNTMSLSVDEAVNFSRPSIDVLFQSAAESYGPSLVGIVLTGASQDGSHGLSRIKEFGGLAIVQNPSSAQAPLMPSSAINATEVDHILNLANIGYFLAELGNVERGI